MVVVSNTSPLHYFIAVQRSEVLPQLFTKVHVPQAVVRELSHAGTPVPIRRWIENRPAWLLIDSLVRPLDPDLATSLDEGEAEAIQLAEEQNADILILDEWKGRTIARRRGLPLTGALGILGLAYQKHLLDDPIRVLAAMRGQGFRIREELVAQFEQLLRTSYTR